MNFCPICCFTRLFMTFHVSNGCLVQNFKGLVLDMAKSLTFPLPLLAVAHQQLIYGKDLKSCYTFESNMMGHFLTFTSNLVLVFPGSSHKHGDDDGTTLVKVIFMLQFSLIEVFLVGCL